MPDLSLKHGSLWAYTKGCRCDKCREARNEYMRGWKAKSQGIKKKRGWQGRSVRVDAKRIRALMEGRTADEFCADSGINTRTFAYLMVHGSTTEKTLDLIACGLGCHMSQLERG